jgi:hypothetical protein
MDFDAGRKVRELSEPELSASLLDAELGLCSIV